MSIEKLIPSVDIGEEMYCKPEGIYVKSKDLDNDELIVQASAPQNGGMMFAMIDAGYGLNCKRVGEASTYVISTSSASLSGPTRMNTLTVPHNTPTSMKNKTDVTADQTTSTWKLKMTSSGIQADGVGQGSVHIDAGEDVSNSLDNHQLLLAGSVSTISMYLHFGGLASGQKLSVKLMASAATKDGTPRAFDVSSSSNSEGTVEGRRLQLDAEKVGGDSEIFVLTAAADGTVEVKLTPSSSGGEIFLNGMEVQEI